MNCNGTASGGILFVSEVYGIPPNMYTWNWMWHFFCFFLWHNPGCLKFQKKDLPIDRHHDFVSTVSLAGDRFRVPWWRKRMGWPIVQCTKPYRFLYISACLTVFRSTWFYLSCVCLSTTCIFPPVYLSQSACLPLLFSLTVYTFIFTRETICMPVHQKTYIHIIHNSHIYPHINVFNPITNFQSQNSQVGRPDMSWTNSTLLGAR